MVMSSAGLSSTVKDAYERRLLNNQLVLGDSMSPGQWNMAFCTSDAVISTDMIGMAADSGVPIVVKTAPTRWGNAEKFTNPKCEWCSTRGPDDYYGNCRSCGGPRP